MKINTKNRKFHENEIKIHLFLNHELNVNNSQRKSTTLKQTKKKNVSRNSLRERFD